MGLLDAGAHPPVLRLAVCIALGLGASACSSSYGETPRPSEPTPGDPSSKDASTPSPPASTPPDGGGATPDGSAGGLGCANRTGVFVYSSKRTSGTCSEVNASFSTENCTQAFCVAYLAIYTAGTDKQVQPASPGCTGNVKTSADNCVTEFSYKCTTQAGDFQHVGRTTWSRTGLSGTGTSQITTYDNTGAVNCTAGYDVSIRK